MSAVPPVNPPEVTLEECRDCEGTGETVHHDGPLGPLVAVVEWCEHCGGEGRREPVDEGDPFAPDHWKDLI